MMRSVMQNPNEVAAAQAAQARDAAQSAQQQARNAAEQARDIARANREAAQAERDAAVARREAAQAAGEGGKSGAVVTITKDGKTITLDNASPDAVATALGLPLPDRQPESDGPYVVGGLAILSTAIVVLAAVVMWYRTKMRGSAPAALPADLAQRLTRMEAGIESVAVEVERISEGQRFTTRLLSDRDRVEVPRG